MKQNEQRKLGIIYEWIYDDDQYNNEDDNAGEITMLILGTMVMMKIL